MPKATTVRFSDEVYARLDQAAARTGMPVNSIVVAACLEWMQRHTPDTPFPVQAGFGMAPAPRWATIRRAVVEAAAGGPAPPPYPFERFTSKAQGMLTAAQGEALKSGNSYIGTEHLLLAAFVDGTSHSAIVLGSLGVREDAVRQIIEERLEHAKKPRRNPQIVPTSRVKKVVELAFRLCGAAGDPLVTTGHILLAVATEGEGIAAQVLNDAGAPPERITDRLDKLLEPET
jgi:ATP-dependent Clp protease ATP-binding subunit ClpC